MNARTEVISGVAPPADLGPASPRPMIAVLDAKPGHLVQLRRLIADLSQQVRREPGCLTFIPYQRHGGCGRFYLDEVYRDLEAFRAHPRTEHVKHFVTTAPGLCSNDPSQALAQLDKIPVPPQ